MSVHNLSEHPDYISTIENATINDKIFSNGGDSGMTIEARVARLESDVQHIRSDVHEMKGTIKDLANKVEVTNEKINSSQLSLNEKINTVQVSLLKEMSSNFRWLIGIFITVTLACSGGLFACIAHGFHWF